VANTPEDDWDGTFSVRRGCDPYCFDCCSIGHLLVRGRAAADWSCL